LANKDKEDKDEYTAALARIYLGLAILLSMSHETIQKLKDNDQAKQCSKESLDKVEETLNLFFN